MFLVNTNDAGSLSTKKGFGCYAGVDVAKHPPRFFLNFFLHKVNLLFRKFPIFQGFAFSNPKINRR